MRFFISFCEGQLKQHNVLQLYTANIFNSYIVFNPLKWHSSSFRRHRMFPILMVQMFFSQIQQAPGPDFRKVEKSLQDKKKLLDKGYTLSALVRQTSKLKPDLDPYCLTL